MSKHILTFGLLGGAIIELLRLVEYQYLVIEHSVEIYGALVACVFATFGIWLGLRLTRGRERVVVREVEVPAPAIFERDAALLSHVASEHDGGAAPDLREVRPILGDLGLSLFLSLIVFRVTG